MLTLKQFLGGRTTAIIGVVTSRDGERFSVRLRHARGIGCVTAELAPVKGGKWEHITGRFGDETNMRHIVTCIRMDSLVPGCAFVLTPAAQEQFTAAEMASGWPPFGIPAEVQS